MDCCESSSGKPQQNVHYASSIGSLDSELDVWTVTSSSTCSTVGTDTDSGVGINIPNDELAKLEINRGMSVTPTDLWANQQFDDSLLINTNSANDPRRYSDDPCPTSPLYQENEYQYYQPKRSSSLKTRRTPPGTPGSANKMVRFADAFGLDLETVRHVFNQESPPKIPASATWDLQLDASNEKLNQKFLVTPRFAQPGGSGTFLHRVKHQGVCLENTIVNGSELAGTVRVFSYCPNKRVTIRVTFNSWRTSIDVPTTYVQNSYDGVMDRFSFNLALPEAFFSDGVRLEFAIQYLALDCHGEYWDNNCGVNYVYECSKIVQALKVLGTDEQNGATKS